MSKKKFDPSVISNATPAGGLPPFDFMRPMEDTVEKPTSPAKAEQVPAPPPVAPAQAAGDLPIPPSRETQIRVLIGARVAPEVAKRVKRFAQDKNVDIQDVAQYALDEWLTRRGY